MSRRGGISLGLRVGQSVGETLGMDDGMADGIDVGHGSVRCPKYVFFFIVTPRSGDAVDGSLMNIPSFVSFS